MKAQERINCTGLLNTVKKLSSSPGMRLIFLSIAFTLISSAAPQSAKKPGQIYDLAENICTISDGLRKNLPRVNKEWNKKSVTATAAISTIHEDTFAEYTFISMDATIDCNSHNKLTIFCHLKSKSDLLKYNQGDRVTFVGSVSSIDTAMFGQLNLHLDGCTFTKFNEGQATDKDEERANNESESN